MINRNTSLDPRRLGSANPVSVCGHKPRGRPKREEPDSWENHDRGKLHLFRLSGREAPGGSSEAPRRPSHDLEKKAVILIMGKQNLGKATTDDPPKRAGDQSIYSNLPDSTRSSPVFRTRAGKREDIISLRKHLDHARRLASAVKSGQSYFYLLQKEEQEEWEREERWQVRREEQRRTEPRPPRFSSDSDSDSEGWPVPAGASCSGGNEARPRRKKSQSARPFTPIHHSLACPLLSEAPREVIYHQLCCLNWLLEALTLDCSGRVGPLTACWDHKDPGRGSATMKTLKKERAIENKWEQFVSTKPGRTRPRRPHSSSARLRARQKSSSLSTLTLTTAGGSLASLVPDTEEDTEDAGAAEEAGRPPSECFHTPTHVRQRFKECQSPRSSSVAASCPAKPPPAVSHVISSKTSMLRRLRAAFDEKAEETAQSYIDTLELKARERLDSGLRRYGALCHMTESHHAPHHVTCKSQETEAPNSNNKNNHSNNMWLSTLLSSLPVEVCKERAVGRVLQKLRGFAEQQTIRVRPHVFLRVLGGLEPWELCLPELCVAIQIAMQHVVQMPREEYEVWLRSRVTLPPQCHRAAHTPGEPHSAGRPERKVTDWDK
ncbi:coiled-coil domain-containing protein 60 [Seriola lalandi dorsalis]|uniref:coiled-coil domain-containing protein 60 n=1 Tax=Seriola lalandi dorsalis TaxID=1841481 RepID=UPI000C6FA9D7|nr:coiled-coil domain-containing protein 60 [Seriola lalandi dorsalis]